MNGQGSGKGNDKKARLAEALRANLRRRREQARLRAAVKGQVEHPEEGQPEEVLLENVGSADENSLASAVKPPQITMKRED
ncbi:MAG: hypothetical protein FD175_2033 [Beijerinckiaceae bacterium]|nr:MAG: hypothetical protein FD175_2033 [Beijerinckiaceae bacterium]